MDGLYFRAKYSSFVISSMALKTSTFFDLKMCLRSKAPHSTRTRLDAAMRGRKKRKQGEDDALVGQTMQHGFMLRTREHDMPIGGLMIRQGRASNQWLYSLETSSCGLLYWGGPCLGR